MPRFNYKYINFRFAGSLGKTDKYFCKNNKSGVSLGHISWHGPWRQYCYFSTNQAVYSAGCLDDISAFIKELMHERSVK